MKLVELGDAVAQVFPVESFESMGFMIFDHSYRPACVKDEDGRCIHGTKCVKYCWLV